MAHGLQVWDANGVLIFDSSTLACQLIDTFVVGATASGNKSYTWMDTGTYSLFAIAIGQLQSAGGHNMTWSGNTVTWTVVTGPVLNVYRNVASNVFVFLV